MTDADRLHRAGFRAVLHAWARQQLAERSWHRGPFEIVDVRMTYDPGFGGSDVTPADEPVVDVVIWFRHEGKYCRLPPYLGDGPCRDTRWSPGGSITTIAMLNQLLMLGTGT